MKDKAAIEAHPLYPVFMAAIEQAMYGKGERHGGNVTPFMEQPWAHYAEMHGRGFLTGQAAKKLEEAASTREGEAFKLEVLGAIVYCGMSVIHEEGKKVGEQGASEPAGDWIEWGGGECPVPRGTLIQVKLRDGFVSSEQPALEGFQTGAEQWRIGYDNDRKPCGLDIIAYRVLK